MLGKPAPVEARSHHRDFWQRESLRGKERWLAEDRRLAKERRLAEETRPKEPLPRRSEEEYRQLVNQAKQRHEERMRLRELEEYRRRIEAKPPRQSRHIPQDVKIAVTLRDGGKCRVCGSKERLQYDHIYPWSLGGRSDDPNNIQLLCGYHDRLKSNG